MEHVGDSTQDVVKIKCRKCKGMLSFEVKEYGSGRFHPLYVACGKCAHDEDQKVRDASMNQIICNSPDCERCVELRNRVS